MRRRSWRRPGGPKPHQAFEHNLFLPESPMHVMDADQMLNLRTKYNEAKTMF